MYHTVCYKSRRYPLFSFCSICRNKFWIFRCWSTFCNSCNVSICSLSFGVFPATSSL